MKDSMKKVWLWLHKVGNQKEALDFLIEFILKLITFSYRQPKALIFFNDYEELEAIK